VKRLTPALAATLLAASLLSGCGGGGGADAYCDTLEETQKDFEDFDTGDLSNFDDFTDRVEDLADDAPDEVRDDWKVVDKAFGDFMDAMDEAGLKPSDLPAAAGGDLPEGVDMEEFSQAMAAAQGLTTDEVQKALENIQKHAKDECNLDFEAS
jgi:hypothetical protein